MDLEKLAAVGTPHKRMEDAQRALIAISNGIAGLANEEASSAAGIADLLAEGGELVERVVGRIREALDKWRAAHPPADDGDGTSAERERSSEEAVSKRERAEASPTTPLPPQGGGETIAEETQARKAVEGALTPEELQKVGVAMLSKHAGEHSARSNEIQHMRRLGYHAKQATVEGMRPHVSRFDVQEKDRFARHVDRGRSTRALNLAIERFKTWWEHGPLFGAGGAAQVVPELVGRVWPEHQRDVELAEWNRREEARAHQRRVQEHRRRREEQEKRRREEQQTRAGSAQHSGYDRDG